MSDTLKQKSPYAFRLHALPETSALVFFAALYVCGSIVWANLPPDAREELTENWELPAVFLLPPALIIFQMLSRLLRAPWFSIVIIFCLTAVAACGAVLLPAEAALARVYRTFPFAALAATLAASLLACILSRPWNRRRIPYLVLHWGLLVGIAGGFVSLLFRASGFAVLKEGESTCAVTLRDYVLTIAAESGESVRLRLPFEGTRGGAGRKYSTAVGGLRLETLYERSRARGRPSRLVLFAEDGQNAATAELDYGSGSAVLELGATRYTVDFGPTVLALPFEIALEDSRAEWYAASDIPREFCADVTIAPGDGSPKRSETLRVNHPASQAGFDVLLSAVYPEGSVVLEISRDRGAPVLFAGGALVIIGVITGLASRLKHKDRGVEADET